MSPTISILMSVYNNQLYLAEAIESMLNQSFSDFEFIIVDDGSSDGSGDMIRHYADNDERIIFSTLNENKGLATALNHGLSLAKGQYIARMDSDDISLPERLQKQVAYLSAHPEIGVLGSRMQVVNKDKNPLFAYDVPLQHSLIVWNLFFGRTFAHPSVMMRRHILESVKGYNMSLKVAQDVDLWARLVGLVQFANLPDELILYRTHEQASSVTKSEQQNTVLLDISKRLLNILWGEVPYTTVQRFLSVRSGQSQFSMGELEQITADMTRLTQSLQTAGWILPEEIPLIIKEMERRLNLAKPRQRKFWNFWHNRKD